MTSRILTTGLDASLVGLAVAQTVFSFVEDVAPDSSFKSFFLRALARPEVSGPLYKVEQWLVSPSVASVAAASALAMVNRWATMKVAAIIQHSPSRQSPPSILSSPQTFLHLLVSNRYATLFAALAFIQRLPRLVSLQGVRLIKHLSSLLLKIVPSSLCYPKLLSTTIPASFSSLSRDTTPGFSTSSAFGFTPASRFLLSLFVLYTANAVSRFLWRLRENFDAFLEVERLALRRDNIQFTPPNALVVDPIFRVYHAVVNPVFFGVDNLAAVVEMGQCAQARSMKTSPASFMAKDALPLNAAVVKSLDPLHNCQPLDTLSSTIPPIKQVAISDVTPSTIPSDSVPSLTPATTNSSPSSFTPCVPRLPSSTSSLLPRRPILFVGNHAMLGMDLPPLVWTMCRLIGLYPRGLAHSGHFDFPIWGRTLRWMGGVLGSRDVCAYLMREGHPLLVYPGGSREVMRKKGDDLYTLIWGERLGFAKLALQHKAIVVPLAVVGSNDMLQIAHDIDFTWLYGRRRIPKQCPPTKYCYKYETSTDARAPLEEKKEVKSGAFMSPNDTKAYSLPANTISTAIDIDPLKTAITKKAITMAANLTSPTAMEWRRIVQGKATKAPTPSSSTPSPSTPASFSPFHTLSSSTSISTETTSALPPAMSSSRDLTVPTTSLPPLAPQGECEGPGGKGKPRGGRKAQRMWSEERKMSNGGTTSSPLPPIPQHNQSSSLDRTSSQNIASSLLSSTSGAQSLSPLQPSSTMTAGTDELPKYEKVTMPLVIPPAPSSWQRYYFSFGEPIDASAWEGDDDKSCIELREAVRAAIERDISRLLKYQKNDPDRYV